MVTINKLQVAPDMKSIIIQVTAAAGFRIDYLDIADEVTSGDTVIDLSDKLLMTSEYEDILLLPIDLSESASSFNGIYFITIGTTEPGVENVTYSICNISQFFFCVNKSLSMVDEDCLSCDESLKNALTIDLYLEALKHSMVLKRDSDSVKNFFALKRLCDGSVDDCATGCSSGYGVLNGDFILM